MGLRKLCPTKKITVTASKMLYDEIEKYITDSMRFATMSEFTDFAIKYFIQRFPYDIERSVTAEYLRRKEENRHMEMIEFDSDYSKEETMSWQATVPLGSLMELSSFQGIFGVLDPINMIRFSVEYYFKCLQRSTYLKVKMVRNEIPDNYELPPIKFKPLKPLPKKTKDDL